MADGVEILIYSLELVAVSLISIFPYFTLLYHNECQSQTWRTAKTKEKSIVFFGKKCFQPKVSSWSENLGPRCIYIFAFNVSYSAKLTLTIYRCNIYCFIMEMKKNSGENSEATWRSFILALLVLEVASSPLGINTGHRIATGSFSRSVWLSLPDYHYKTYRTLFNEDFLHISVIIQMRNKK